MTAVAAALVGASLGNDEARAVVAEATAGSDLIGWIQVLATVLAGAFIITGVLELRRSRTRAYRAFELAIFVDLLLVQPFAFLQAGFGATVDVSIDLALLATLRYLDTQEQQPLLRRA